jgi:hypothetical protein
VVRAAGESLAKWALRCWALLTGRDRRVGSGGLKDRDGLECAKAANGPWEVHTVDNLLVSEFVRSMARDSGAP